VSERALLADLSNPINWVGQNIRIVAADTPMTLQHKQRMLSYTIAQQAQPIIAPPIAPPIALAAPMPPPPALPAGLRALLEGTGCVGACMERGEDWFESERPNLGVLSSVAAMVRAKLAENFLESLRPLEPAAEALVRSRLEAVAAQQHVQSGRRLGGATAYDPGLLGLTV